MGALTNFAESGLLNYLFRGGTFAKPSELYVGLLGAFDPDEMEKGNISSEITGGGYQRVKFPCNEESWKAPYSTGTAMMVHNQSGILFPVATSAQGFVSGVFLINNGTDVLFYGALTTVKNIRVDDQFTFASGALKITFD
jgi:hypothetical protein